MELLESRGVRPRQARYQAALRPDMKCTIDSKALSNSTATPVPDIFIHCTKHSHWTTAVPESSAISLASRSFSSNSVRSRVTLQAENLGAEKQDLKSETVRRFRALCCHKKPAETLEPDLSGLC